MKSKTINIKRYITGDARERAAFSVDPPSFVTIHAGDADQDLDFDQLDLVQVQVAGKYLTGKSATWGDGDWNGAPLGLRAGTGISCNSCRRFIGRSFSEKN